MFLFQNANTEIVKVRRAWYFFLMQVTSRVERPAKLHVGIHKKS